MTGASDASTRSRRSAWTRGRTENPTEVPTEIPMTTPLVAGVCPCGRPGGDDGFCDDHAGAIAFKVPVSPRGEVLPAVWWHWPHPAPCPEGETWVVKPPAGGTSATVWACAHRTHELPEQATGCSGRPGHHRHPRRAMGAATADVTLEP